jgi:hypothetical protein
MDERLVQIEVERGGTLASVRKGVPANEVAGIIQSRSVLGVETAASVAHEWLKGGRQASSGAWERK